MKHVAVKSLLSVVLSLMMVVVFTPAMAFANNTDATNVDQGVALEAEPGEMVEVPVAPIDQELEAVNEYDTEGIGGGLNPVKATDYSKYGTLTVNSPSTPSKAGAGKVSKMTRSSAGTAYWPLTVSGPCVIAVYGYYDFTTSTTAKVNIYRTLSGGSLSNPVMSSDMNLYNGSVNARYFPLNAGATYYLGVTLPSGTPVSSTNNMTITLCVDKYGLATNGSTISPNKMYGVCTYAANSVVNLNLKAAKTGYLRVYTDAYTSTVLKKADGTTLGSQQSTSYYPTFGVKKSRNYQLTTTLPSYSLSYNGFFVYAKNTAIKNKSGSSKKKAKSLTRSKYKKGLFIAGSTKAQWFKFKKTKSGSLKIYIKGATNNEFKFRVYRGGKNVGGTFTLPYNYSGNTISGTGASGTWYIKVWPTKSSSGWYKVRWK